MLNTIPHNAIDLREKTHRQFEPRNRQRIDAIVLVTPKKRTVDIASVLTIALSMIILEECHSLTDIENSLGILSRNKRFSTFNLTKPICYEKFNSI
jgi:energy-coupling factor transporter ATP-binding protein EcfA2